MNDGLQLFLRGDEKPEPKPEPKFIFSQEPMCKDCLTHCRDFYAETEGGRWPVPLHSPGCVHYKREKFFRVGLFGHSCIMTEQEKDDELSENPDEEDYDIEEVWLCRDQVESLPEFEGW
jgi:hypothetical protein